MLIRVVPLGNISSETVKQVVESVKKAFACDCVIDNPILNVPKSPYDQERKQYGADGLVGFLRPYVREKKCDKMLAICNIDIFSKGLNFVFGVAQKGGKICLISLYRLNQRYYSLQSDAGLLKERASKEAVHELGHCFGLNHCDNDGCVMAFSNEIVSVDKKGAKFCDSCKQKIAKKLKS